MSPSDANSNADQPTLELRLLAGVHAGATVSLAAGQSVTVGSSGRCEVVLRDAPFSEARLEPTSDGWLWFESDGTRQALKTGSALKAGGLLFTVEAANQAWRRADEVPVGWRRPAFDNEGAPAQLSPTDPKSDNPDTDLAEASVDRAGAADSPANPTAGLDDPASPSRLASGLEAPPAARAWRRHLAGSRRVWWVAPAALLVGLAWFGGASLYDVPARKPVPPTAPATDPASTALQASSDDLSRVVQRIAEGGFNEVARASLRADGRIEVLGVLESVDEQDELIQWLSPERRWLALNLITQQEFAERVRAAAKLLPEGFELSGLPGGRVVLTGLAVAPDEASRARATVEQQLPHAAQWMLRLSSPRDVAEQLNREAQALGLPSVRAAWIDSRISVEGAMPRERSTLLEQVLLRFSRQYGERLPTRVTLSLTDPAPAPATAVPSPASAAPPPKLPRIVAVQSGPLSYLLFADGHRVLPGGMINGYRLTSIGDTDIVLEDAAGTQHRIPR